MGKITELKKIRKALAVQESSERVLQLQQRAAKQLFLARVKFYSKVVVPCFLLLLVLGFLSTAHVWEVGSSNGVLGLVAKASNGITGLFFGILSGDPPTVSNLELNTTDHTINHTTVDLQGYWVISDGESDPVKNISTWYVNDVPWAFAHLPFEVNSSTNNLTDYSGRANHASIVGNPVFNASGGYDGWGAFQFDGSGDGIVLPSAFAEATVTYLIWIKVADTGYRRIFYGDAGSDNGWYAQGSRVHGYGISCLTSASSLPTNVWTHFAMTYDGTDSKLYINGALDTTKAGVDCREPSGVKKIGQDNGGEDFLGVLDEPLFINRSLTAAQIANIFNNQSYLLDSDETLEGQTWNISVTANDGLSDSPTVTSSNVTINELVGPAIADLSIGTTNANKNTTDFNLSASWSITFGDFFSVYNVTNWFKEGVSRTIFYGAFEKANGSASENGQDYSGYKNTVTDQNGVAWNATSGHDGWGAYEFDGSNDFLKATSLPQLKGNISISYWANRTGTRHEAFAITTDDGTNANTPFGWDGAQMNVGDGSNSEYVAVTLTAVQNEWTHIVFIVDGNQLLQYNNSELTDNITLTYLPSPLATKEFRIGRGAFSDGFSEKFEGALDDFRIYNYSLSTDQVRVIYEKKDHLYSNEETALDDVWAVEITPNDGTADGTKSLSANLTIVANTAPTVVTGTFTPDPAFNNTTLVVNTSYSDADADTGTVYFEWYVNNSLVHNVSNSSVADGTFINSSLDVHNFTRGDLVNVSIYADDGTDTAGIVNTSITISNFVPEVSQLELNSTDHTVNDSEQNLTAYWFLADADTDLLKNITNWYLNGSPYTVFHMPFEKIIDGEFNFTKDYSGFENNASEHGGPDHLPAGGYDGKGAADFDGSFDYLDTGINEVSTMQKLTVMAWIKNPGADSSLRVIAGNRESGGLDRGWEFYMYNTANGDKLLFQIDVGASTPYMIGTTDVRDGTWRHVAGTWNGSHAHVYVDGVNDDSATFVNAVGDANSTGPFMVGRSPSVSSSSYFAGQMDDILIFNDTLTEQQIAHLYNNNSHLLDSALTSLGDVWNISVTANDGTADGSTVFSNNVTILAENTAPTIVTGIFTPDPAYNNTSIVVNTSYSDADGNTGTVTFEWYVNSTLVHNVSNSSIADGTFINSTLDQNNFSKGDVVNVTIYADDGTDVSSQQVTTITISNLIPGAIQLELNSTDHSNNNTNQNLTAFWVNVDNDKDNVKNITNWWLHDASIAVLHIPFEVNGSQDNAVDYSGNGNNATEINGATYNATGGHDGFGAYHFDGSNDFIRFEENGGTMDFANVTMAAWVLGKIDTSDSNARYIIDKRTAALGNQELGFWVRGTGAIGCDVWLTTTDTFAEVASSITMGVWTHIACVWDETSLKIYSDGVLVHEEIEGAGTVDQHSSPLWVGKRSDGAGSNFFLGEVDELMVFNRSLTPEQILNIYNNKSYLLDANETSLNDVWNFSITPNDGTEDGTTVFSNNLTISAANSLPTAPVLVSPTNASTRTNRTGTFIWNNSVDGDADTLTYQLLIDDDASFNNPEVNITSIAEGTTNTTHDLTADLDVDLTYYWKVRANDSTGYGAYSEAQQFDLDSLLSISILGGTVNFTGVERGKSNNTSTGAPPPFAAENSGNIVANVTITATQFFPAVKYPSNNYQFKIRENETGAFDTSASTTDWANMTNVTGTPDVQNLTWQSIKNDFLLDILVDIPTNESEGAATSTVTFTIE